jgi:hypothetical protein
MKKLSNEQLLNKTGQGWLSCAFGVVGLGLATAGLIVATGGAGAVLAAVSFSIAPAATALSCLPGGV